MLNVQNINFSAEFENAYNVMENSKDCVFLTGKAGTGKSTLLRYFCENTQKNVVVLAPTGIAAINVRGQTIHSFFGFPPHPIGRDDIKKRRNAHLYQKVDTIVIDEISMVRADMLDAIDYFLRLHAKHRHLPFGGIQMIFVGDLFQLPPIVSSEAEKNWFQFLYPTPYFFSANCLKMFDLQVIELNKVYRQADLQFLSLLDRIRTKNLDEYDLEYLNQAYKANFIPPETDYYITLATNNSIAQNLNDHKLDLIREKPYRFTAETEGSFDLKNAPNDPILTLKEGAQVMFVKNDPKYRWVNGTIGKIQYVDDEILSVKISGTKYHTVHEVEKVTSEIVRYTWNETAQKIDKEIIGKFTQFPIKLAWAITIHKSQGKTFDKVVIDIGKGTFAPGQLYVALSRCTSFEGIVLKQKIQHKDIIIDPKILNFKFSS